MAIKESTKKLNKSVNKAEKNARERDLKNDKKNKIAEDLAKKRAEFETLYEALNGEKPGIYTKKKQNSKVPFAQIIQPNVRALVSSGYLSQTEESYIFRLSGFLEFKSNCIVEKDYKNDENNGLEKTATVTSISKMIGISRIKVSEMMNRLKDKGVLATAETGMITEDGRICTARTWFMNPNIVYCGDKADIDLATQRIFKDSLKNIIDKNGKKVKLPIRLFL